MRGRFGSTRAGIAQPGRCGRLTGAKPVIDAREVRLVTVDAGTCDLADRQTAARWIDYC